MASAVVDAKSSGRGWHQGLKRRVSCSFERVQYRSGTNFKTRKPRNASAVLFGLKFADITKVCKSSQASGDAKWSFKGFCSAWKVSKHCWPKILRFRQRVDLDFFADHGRLPHISESPDNRRNIDVQYPISKPILTLAYSEQWQMFNRMYYHNFQQKYLRAWWL